MTNAVTDVINSQSTDTLQDITSLGNTWDFGSIFENFGQDLLQGNGELNLGNIDLNFFEEEFSVVNDFLDDALQGLCQ